MTTSSAQLDELCINTIRTLSMDAVQKANSGHPGTAMALAPLAYVLYTRVMRHNPQNPDWADRDRFVLSAGHASMLLYSMLYLTGYPLTLEDIKNFRQVGSPTAGHPERKYSPGIEATTGPLGQGISMSVGLALGERMLAARFNRGEHPIVDHHTFTIASDGDIQEGVASEACSLAGHLGLGSLIAFYDANNIQLASEVAVVMTEDVGKRFEAYQWHVTDVGEDLSVETLERATREAMEVEDRPSLVIVRSHIGIGSPLQDTSKAHGSPLGEDNVRETKENYGWDPDAQFLVPDDALEHFRACCERGAELEEAWKGTFSAYREAEPELAKDFEDLVEGRMPEGFDADPPRFEAGDKMATRKASGAAVQWAAAQSAAPGGGRGRPGQLDQHRHRRRRRRSARPVRRPQPALRRARARHGRRGQRPHAARLPRLRQHVPDLLRLHEGRHPALGAAEAALDLGLHPRLDRPRRGRPDPPADRAAGRPARHAAPERDPPRRRQRDRAGLALRPAPDRRAHRVRAVAPGPADPRPRPRARRRDRARGLRPARLRRTAASPT